MLFNSLEFILFFLIFLLGWRYAKNKTGMRLWWIFIASAVFYGWWDWRFLFLILFTGAVDFFLALGIEKANKISDERWRSFLSKLFVTLSIVAGIGVLSIFKYSSFFADWISSFLSLFGMTVQLKDHIPDFCLILPVGISFYTFQSLSYTIDVYRRNLQPTRSFVHYMAYLMLFPQLVAGPIVRAVDLLPKLLQKPVVSPMIQYNALKLIILGFFKKCVLADHAAHIVDTAFTSPYVYTGSWTWFLVMVLFSIQIYCDFSGYSDIARGIIKFMGYRFNLNFNHPYIACGLRDFWSRWHISLSTWFRDYVYIPLGGNRKGKLRTDFNLFFTFLLSGLWHGAAWNFIIWGAYHGVILIAEKLLKLPEFLKRTENKIKIGLIIVLTQIEVLVGWIFFRATNMSEVKHIFSNLFSFHGESSVFEPVKKAVVIFFIFLIMEAFLISGADRKLLRKYSVYRKLEPVLAGILVIMIICFKGEGHGFIYFQF